MKSEIIHIEESSVSNFLIDTVSTVLKSADISLNRNVRKLSVSASRQRGEAGEVIVSLRVLNGDDVSLTPDEADALADVIRDITSAARRLSASTPSHAS